MGLANHTTEDYWMFIKRALAGAALTLAAGSAAASNFSYTTLGFDLGWAELDPGFVIDNAYYDELGAASIYGSYQFAENVVGRLSSSALANSGAGTEFTQSDVALSLLFPVSLSGTVDIVPHIGLVASELEVCNRRRCWIDDENATVYGIYMRVWAAPETLEFSVGVSDSTFSDSETLVTLEGRVWLNRNNSIGLNFSGADSISIFTAGYRYSW